MPACPRLLPSLSNPGKRNLCVLSWKGGCRVTLKTGNRHRGSAFVLPGLPRGFPGAGLQVQPEKQHFAIQTCSRGNFAIPFPAAARDSRGGVRPSLHEFSSRLPFAEEGRTCNLPGSFFRCFQQHWSLLAKNSLSRFCFVPVPHWLLFVGGGSSGTTEAVTFYLLSFI